MEKNNNKPNLVNASELYSVSEASRKLNITRNTVYEYMRNFDIKDMPERKKLKGVPYNGGLAVLIPEPKEDQD